MEVIRPKRILHWKLVQFCLSVTYCSIVQSFWKFAQSTAVMLPFDVQNVKTFDDRHEYYNWKMRFGEIWIGDEFRPNIL